MRKSNLLALGISSLAILIGSSACSASNDASPLNGDHEATGENSAALHLRIPVGTGVLPPAATVPNCGWYTLQAIVLSPSAGCPDVSVPGGVMRGRVGTSWISAIETADTETAAQIQSRNPWLTDGMVHGAPPFCAYNYVPSDPADTVNRTWDYRDALGPQTYAGCGWLWDHLQPGHTPCAGCTISDPVCTGLGCGPGNPTNVPPP